MSLNTETVMSSKESGDTYQRFQVKPPTCHVLQVTVVRGQHIRQKKEQANETNRFNSIIHKAEKMFMDVPDCYVTVKIRNTPNGLMRTKTVNNESNPEWNETFTFYINPDIENVMEIAIIDTNYVTECVIATETYDLVNIPTDAETSVKLAFHETEAAELELIFHRKNDDNNPFLRYSSELCDEEKQFLKNRKQNVLKGLQRFLNKHEAPQNEDEVPTIAILGSGGGFRAMVGFSGVIQAASDSGLFDCATYTAGLSGSTWYLSWLYSHSDFPEKTTTELQKDLQERIGHSPFQLLGPHNAYSYMEVIMGKRKSGQPVSFTDLFGLMVGNTLMKDRLGAKLSEQRDKVQMGTAPLPIYTCIHVKKHVQARVFNEWIEFTPYEVGIPKYGTFMRSEHFGSTFYLGRILKPFPENPLHFLQGIWGSAFSVLMRQLLWIVQTDATGMITRYCSPGIDDERLDKELDTFRVLDEDDGVNFDDITMGNNPASNFDIKHDASNGDTNADAWLMQKSFVNDIRSAAKKGMSSIWEGALNTVASMDILNTLGGRAASIFNPLRGLEVEPLFSGDLTKTTPQDEENFKGIQEPLSTKKSTLYMVDGGLGFNSPYSVLLRPQRGVQLYISYDFSSRPSDNTPPFKELLLAEQWAQKMGLPFPPIAKPVKDYLKEPLKECYVFRDDDNTECPIIVHFVLINKSFREYKSPGVRRETKEEKDFADFSLFDGSVQPFSTFNFEYTTEHFAQLTGLTSFNVLSNMDTIKDIVAELVKRKRVGDRIETNEPSEGILGRLFSHLSMLFGGSSQNS